MKNFRIYENDCGWELLTIKNDLYETKREVGKLVKKNKKIIVIEHDIELDQDDVIPIKQLINK